MSKIENVSKTVGAENFVCRKLILGKKFRVYGTLENPLFLARDVAEWIENPNPSQMVRTVDDNEKLMYTIYISGQNRECLFLTEDGVIQNWTGWYFDDIGSGHQACITLVHDGEFYPVLVDWEKFVPLPHHPKDFIKIHGQLKILTMGGFQRIVIVADSFKISPS